MIGICFGVIPAACGCRYRSVSIGCVLSNRLAKRRGYDADRYTVYGAVWSALLLLPVIWLVLKLKGVSLPRGIVGLGYGIIYTGWFVSENCPNFIMGSVNQVRLRNLRQSV